MTTKPFFASLPEPMRADSLNVKGLSAPITSHEEDSLHCKLAAVLESFSQAGPSIATSNLPAPSNAELGALIDNALNTVKNTLATLTLDEARNVLRHGIKQQQGARTASELQAFETGFLGLFNILASSIIDSAPGAMCDFSTATFLK